MRPGITTLYRFLQCVAFSLVLPTALEAADAAPAESPPVLTPVTSHLMDVTDDPEFSYSGAPKLDWAFFGNRMRLIAKHAHVMADYRRKLGIDTRFNLIESESVAYPPPYWTKLALDADPAFPALIFGTLGKIIYREGGERPLAHDKGLTPDFLKHYPRAIFGGGQMAEFDTIFSWFYKNDWFFSLLPAGPYGSDMPTAWLDLMESHVERSGEPYLYFQFNRGFAVHPTAKERMLSLASSQLFYRADQVMVPSLTALRSAARQYPYAYGVQFSGQPNVSLANKDEILKDRTKPPLWEYKTNNDWVNYHKSYALNRQALYLSWLNGARFFMWESGGFVGLKGHEDNYPDPLGRFTARADKFIERVGPPGPVQTPIALISEHSRTWRPPVVGRGSDKNGGGGGKLDFSIMDRSPYAPGDYQRHGIQDVFLRHYLQCEYVYAHEMSEKYALCDMPYGASVDLLLSDVRDEALSRYGLVIWSGVPPAVPSMVRDKLLRYINVNKGRVLLFGAAAKRMFPEWFQEGEPTLVPAGASVIYNNETIKESAAFQVESLKDGGAGLPQMRVLGTVNGKPLVVECLGGLVLVLSDYGINSEATLDPKTARWEAGQIVTQIPHTLLTHARRLLHSEALRQIPFTVGNEGLHYVVTRPRDGEYLLGLFNDRMKGQPFEIASNIGPITRIEDIPVDDGVEELKAVAGGLPYAPPGSRLSPEDLPLDYGPSDKSHIEGRGFRLFRITVNEQGVRNVPTITYSARPVGRVLALPGIGHVRRKLQNISMFFSWFDGIKVDAGSFLTEEDAWLMEQGRYLDRRGVRVVVDGTGADHAGLTRALGKLELFKKAPKDLIVRELSADLQEAAKKADVRLVTPTQINRLSAPEHRFKKEATLNILEPFYANEEDLYRDYEWISTGQGTGTLRGKKEALELSPAPRADKKETLYVGPDVDDLSALLRKHRGAFGTLKGVRIDSWYLRSKSDEALAQDQQTLRELGLKVIVDLRRDQTLFDGIGWKKYLPHFENGLKRYDEVIRKMGIIKSSDLIMHFKDGEQNPAYVAERDEVMHQFIKTAADRNVNLHLMGKPGMKFSDDSYLDKANVFIIEGLKGKRPSPYAPTD